MAFASDPKHEYNFLQETEDLLSSFKSRGQSKDRTYVQSTATETNNFTAQQLKSMLEKSRYLFATEADSDAHIYAGQGGMPDMLAPGAALLSVNDAAQDMTVTYRAEIIMVDAMFLQEHLMHGFSLHNSTLEGTMPVYNQKVYPTNISCQVNLAKWRLHTKPEVSDILTGFHEKPVNFCDVDSAMNMQTLPSPYIAAAIYNTIDNRVQKHLKEKDNLSAPIWNEICIQYFLKLCYSPQQENWKPRMTVHGDFVYDKTVEDIHMPFGHIQDTYCQRYAEYNEHLQASQGMSNSTFQDVLQYCLYGRSGETFVRSETFVSQKSKLTKAGIRFMDIIVMDSRYHSSRHHENFQAAGLHLPEYKSTSGSSTPYMDWHKNPILSGSPMNKVGCIPVLRIAVIPTPVAYSNNFQSRIPMSCSFSRVIWRTEKKTKTNANKDAVQSSIPFKNLVQTIEKKTNLHPKEINAIMQDSGYHTLNVQTLFGNKHVPDECDKLAVFDSRCLLQNTRVNNKQNMLLGTKLHGFPVLGVHDSEQESGLHDNMDVADFLHNPMFLSTLEESLQKLEWNRSKLSRFFQEEFFVCTSKYFQFFQGMLVNNATTMPTNYADWTDVNMENMQKLHDILQQTEAKMGTIRTFVQADEDMVQHYKATFDAFLIDQWHKAFSKKQPHVNEMGKFLGHLFITHACKKSCEALMHEYYTLKSESARHMQIALDNTQFYQDWLEDFIRENNKFYDFKHLIPTSWFYKFWRGRNAVINWCQSEMYRILHKRKISSARAKTSTVFLPAGQVNTLVDEMLAILRDPSYKNFLDFDIPDTWTKHLREQKERGGKKYTYRSGQEVWENHDRSIEAKTLESYQHQMATLRYLKMRLVIFMKHELVIKVYDQEFPSLTNNTGQSDTESESSHGQESDEESDEESNEESDEESEGNGEHGDGYESEDTLQHNSEADAVNLNEIWNDGELHENRGFNHLYKNTIENIQPDMIKEFVKTFLDGMMAYFEQEKDKLTQSLTPEKVTSARVRCHVRWLFNALKRQYVPAVIQHSWLQIMYTWIKFIHLELFIKPDHSLIEAYEKKALEAHNSSSNIAVLPQENEASKILLLQEALCDEFLSSHAQWLLKNAKHPVDFFTAEEEATLKNEAQLYMFGKYSLDGYMYDAHMETQTEQVFLDKYGMYQDNIRYDPQTHNYEILHIPEQEVRQFQPESLQSSWLRVCPMQRKHAKNISTILTSVAKHYFQHRRQQKTFMSLHGIASVHFECAMQVGNHKEMDMYYVQIKHANQQTMHVYMTVLHDMQRYTSYVPISNPGAMAMYADGLGLLSSNYSKPSLHPLHHVEHFVCKTWNIDAETFGRMRSSILNVFNTNLIKYIDTPLRKGKLALSETEKAALYDMSILYVDWYADNDNKLLEHSLGRKVLSPMQIHLFNKKGDDASRVKFNRMLDNTFEKFPDVIQKAGRYQSANERLTYLFETHPVTKSILLWMTDRIHKDAFWQFVRARTPEDIDSLVASYKNVNFLPIMSDRSRMSAEEWLILCNRLKFAVYKRYAKRKNNALHNAHIACMKIYEQFDLDAASLGSVHMVSGWRLWLVRNGMYSEEEVAHLFQQYPDVQASPITKRFFSIVTTCFENYANGIDKCMDLQSAMEGIFSFGFLHHENKEDDDAHYEGPAEENFPAFKPDIFVVDNTLLTHTQKYVVDLSMQTLYSQSLQALHEGYFDHVRSFFGDPFDPFSEWLRTKFFGDLAAGRDRSLFEKAVHEWVFDELARKQATQFRDGIVNEKLNAFSANVGTYATVPSMSLNTHAMKLACGQLQSTVQDLKARAAAAKAFKHYNNENTNFLFIPSMQKSFRGGYPTPYLYNLAAGNATTAPNPWAKVVTLHHDLVEMSLQKNFSYAEEMHACCKSISSEIMNICKLLYADSQRFDGKGGSLTREVDQCCRKNIKNHYFHDIPMTSFSNSASLHSIIYHIMDKYPHIALMVQNGMMNTTM